MLQQHSAAYKGCQEFLKAKAIIKFSFNNKITYDEATKQIKKQSNSDTFEISKTNHSVTDNTNDSFTQIMNKKKQKFFE